MYNWEKGLLLWVAVSASFGYWQHSIAAGSFMLFIYPASVLAAVYIRLGYKP